ncbi:hypothetical protein B0H12DRAFT_268744 [Mycena haematopus]|nr:hypothetical protein B0H12DRAFT_268744 [Mycena haematopus]
MSSSGSDRPIRCAGSTTLAMLSIPPLPTTTVRVFPPVSDVLISFCDRVAIEVVAEYNTSLLTRARILNATYLKAAAAATFRESWRMVDTIMKAASTMSGTRARRVWCEYRQSYIYSPTAPIRILVWVFRPS